jgi:hypothetical protein
MLLKWIFFLVFNVDCVMDLFVCIKGLLVDETGLPEENHRPDKVTGKLFTYMLYRVYLALNDVRTHTVAYFSGTLVQIEIKTISFQYVLLHKYSD